MAVPSVAALNFASISPPMDIFPLLRRSGSICILVTLLLRLPMEESIFNKWCWFNWRSACRRMQIKPFLSPSTKFKSKWIKNLHIKQDTLKLIEERVVKSLENMGTGEDFLNKIPMVYALRSRIDKWDLIKLQSFCKAKDTVIEQNGNQQIG